MLTVLVECPVREGMTREQAMEMVRETTHVYEGYPGLVRKYVCFDFERRINYGVYLWEDRTSAEAFYAMARPIIVEQVGGEPIINYFDTLVVVDNAASEIVVDGKATAFAAA